MAMSNAAYEVLKALVEIYPDDEDLREKLEMEKAARANGWNGERYY